MQHNLVKGLAWAGLAIACWVPMFPVAKRTLPHLDAFAIGTVRYAIGIVLMVLLLAAVEGRRALRFEGRLLAASGAGLAGITGFNLLIWIGLMLTRPEHASVILALQTPLTVIAVWLTRGQRPAGFTLGCVAVAIGGVLLVVTRGEPGRALAELASGGELLGDTLIFLGGVAWVIYTLTAPAFRDWSPLRFTVLTCIPGAVGLVIAHAIAIALGIVVVPSVPQVAEVWWQMVYLSVGTVVLGVLGFNAAVKRLGPLNTMLMLNLVPIGVFVIEAALGRSFTLVELGGAGLVIAALAANNLYLRGASTRR